MLQEPKRRNSATSSGWDCPLLTFIYPGFDCGSTGSVFWLWLNKPVPNWNPGCQHLVLRFWHIWQVTIETMITESQSKSRYQNGRYPRTMLQELRRRNSATSSGWDCPLLTFIYPGFDCGSNGSVIWLWLNKPVPNWNPGCQHLVLRFWHIWQVTIETMITES